MTGILTLASYFSAAGATIVFWMGVSEDSLPLRIAGGVIATIGIWFAESGERKAGMSGKANAGMLNVLLLLGMTAISLYLHFAD